jgi:proteasome lid subunit RPN8/RPN11
VVLLEDEVLAAVRAHALAVYPDECCGALFGRDTVGDGGESGPLRRPREILRAIPAGNAWPGARGERYLIPPEAVRALEAAAHRSGLEVVGFYHSHPDGVAVPSAFDLETAWPWYSYLILAVGVEGVGEARSWRLRDDRTGFEEQVFGKE